MVIRATFSADRLATKAVYKLEVFTLAQELPMPDVTPDPIMKGLRGIEWANLGYEGARKLCIS